MIPDFDRSTEPFNVAYWKDKAMQNKLWFKIGMAANVAILIAMTWLLATHTGGAC